MRAWMCFSLMLITHSLLSWLPFFKDRVSYSPSWLQIFYAAYAGLKLMVPWVTDHKCWRLDMYYHTWLSRFFSMCLYHNFLYRVLGFILRLKVLLHVLKIFQNIEIPVFIGYNYENSYIMFLIPFFPLASSRPSPQIHGLLHFIIVVGIYVYKQNFISKTCRVSLGLLVYIWFQD